MNEVSPEVAIAVVSVLIGVITWLFSQIRALVDATSRAHLRIHYIVPTFLYGSAILMGLGCVFFIGYALIPQCKETILAYPTIAQWNLIIPTSD